MDEAAVDRGRSSNLRRDSCGVGGVELLAVVTNNKSVRCNSGRQYSVKVSTYVMRYHERRVVFASRFLQACWVRREEDPYLLAHGQIDRQWEETREERLP